MAVSERLRQMAQEIVEREGGFVNDPDDPGGATNYGVTIGTLRRLGRDMDGDGAVTVADLRKLGPDQAAEIYLEHYFHKPGLDRLPEGLQPTVFDMQVNAGAQAVRLLQRLLCDMGFDVAVDGALGPQTLAAVDRAYARAPERFVDAYGIARRSYYLRLADRRPALRKFARRRDGGKGGWVRRAESFVSKQYHMSDAEFQARVASWG
ncbi:holin-associated N-acetylmuramidase [Pseudoprimorskyibacter insulae]|uniref:Uncharacterized protein n=1 Tax=Pseudoprimorskyibacter insulae TaxID=1695997 RepID=A0A2R8AXI5_9RHOB|nr:holin-associated N-acetylmuramidase [Pseudoprimorskyibacter insulae]SPF80743.1 hypothetical protein PRI8871_02554 [Pseudoprimorskyibacter insulae]